MEHLRFGSTANILRSIAQRLWGSKRLKAPPSTHHPSHHFRFKVAAGRSVRPLLSNASSSTSFLGSKSTFSSLARGQGPLHFGSYATPAIARRGFTSGVSRGLERESLNMTRLFTQPFSSLECVGRKYPHVSGQTGRDIKVNATVYNTEKPAVPLTAVYMTFYTNACLSWELDQMSQMKEMTSSIEVDAFETALKRFVNIVKHKLNGVTEILAKLRAHKIDFVVEPLKRWDTSNFDSGFRLRFYQCQSEADLRYLLMRIDIDPDNPNFLMEVENREVEDMMIQLKHSLDDMNSLSSSGASSVTSFVDVVEDLVDFHFHMVDLPRSRL